MISKIQGDVLVLFKCITDFGEDILRNFTKDRIASKFSSGLYSAFLKEKKHSFYHQWDKEKISCCECPNDGCDIPKTGNMYQNIFDTFYVLDNSFQPLKGHYIRNGTNISKICICQYKEKPISLDDIAHVAICDVNVLLFHLHLISTTEESVLKAFVSLRGRVCDAFYTDTFSETELSSLWPQFTEVIYTICQFHNDAKYLSMLQKAIEATKRNLLSEEEVAELMEKIAAVNNIVHENEEEMKNIIEDGTTEQNNISAGMQNGHEDLNDKKCTPKENDHKCNDIIQASTLTKKENKCKEAKVKKDKKKERQKRNKLEKRNQVEKRELSNSSSTPNKEVEQVQSLSQASSSNTSIQNATNEVSQTPVSHQTAFKKGDWLTNNKNLGDNIPESDGDDNREDDSTIHSGTCEFQTDETDIAKQKLAPSVQKAELDVRPKQSSLYKNLTKRDLHTGISDDGLSMALHEESSYLATTKKRETFNSVQHTPMGLTGSMQKQSDKERRLETAGGLTVKQNVSQSKWSFPPKLTEDGIEQKMNDNHRSSKGYSKDITPIKTPVEPQLSNEEKMGLNVLMQKQSDKERRLETAGGLTLKQNMSQSVWSFPPKLKEDGIEQKMNDNHRSSKGYSKDITPFKTPVEPQLSNEEKLNKDDSQGPGQRSAQSYFRSSNKSLKWHSPQRIRLSERDKLDICVFHICQPLLQDLLERAVKLETRQNFDKYLEDYKHYLYHQLQEGDNRTCQCTKLSPKGRCVEERGFTKVGKLSDAVFKNLYHKKGNCCKDNICLHIYHPKIKRISELDFNDLQFFLLECDHDIISSASKKRSLKEIVDLRNQLCHPRNSNSEEVWKNTKDVWEKLKDNIRNLYVSNISVEVIISQVEGIQQSTTDSGIRDSSSESDSISKMNELLHFSRESNKKVTFTYDMHDDIKVNITASFDEGGNQTDEQTMRRVIWKIDTTNILDHETDKMIELVQKAATSANVWSPYIIECVGSGCIRLCTLLPITWLKTESDFRLSVCNFLDQIVRTCNISTRNPLEMNVEIVIQEYTDQALVHCGVRNRTDLKVYDRATQATVDANDKQTYVTTSDLDSYNQYMIDELASVQESDQLHFESTDDTQAKRIGTNHNTNDDEIIAVQDMNPHEYENLTHSRHIVNAGNGIHYVESCNNELSVQLSNSVIPFACFCSEIQFEMHRVHGNLYQRSLPIENDLTLVTSYI